MTYENGNSNFVKPVSMTGLLKFWNDQKKFGIVSTSAGDVFVHESKTHGMLEDMRKGDAVIALDVKTEFKDEKFKRSATAVTSVTLPAIRTVWAAVKIFNEEFGSAVVHLGELDLLDLTAFLPKKVIQQSTVLPGVGMPMRAVIKETAQGWDVLSYESDEQVAADYKVYMAEMLARIDAQQQAAEVVSTEGQGEVAEVIAEPAPTEVTISTKSQPKSQKVKTSKPKGAEASTTVTRKPKKSVKPVDPAQLQPIPEGELLSVVQKCGEGAETALAAAMKAAAQQRQEPATVH
jgi:cold shock CspA family protein